MPPAGPGVAASPSVAPHAAVQRDAVGRGTLTVREGRGERHLPTVESRDLSPRTGTLHGRLESRSPVDSEVQRTDERWVKKGGKRETYDTRTVHGTGKPGLTTRNPSRVPRTERRATVGPMGGTDGETREGPRLRGEGRCILRGLSMGTPLLVWGSG